jgi:hypothetical protein
MLYGSFAVVLTQTGFGITFFHLRNARYPREMTRIEFRPESVLGVRSLAYLSTDLAECSDTDSYSICMVAQLFDII